MLRFGYVLGGGQFPYLCVADSGSHVLLVSSVCDVFLWEKDTDSSAVDEASSNVCGSWSRVDEHNESVPLVAAAAAAASQELTVHAVFASNPSVCASNNIHCTVCTVMACCLKGPSLQKVE